MGTTSGWSRRVGGRGLVQEAGHAAGAGGDVGSFAGRNPAWTHGGPHQHDAAPAAPYSAQWDRDEGERVGQDGGGPRVAAGHLVLAADADQGVVADRVGGRDGCRQRQALPRDTERHRQTAQRHQAQQRLRLLDQIR
jgi:hypothetical protein